MMVLHYQVGARGTDQRRISLPSGARLLSAFARNNSIWLAALVGSEQEKEPWDIWFVETGVEVPAHAVFVGSVCLDGTFIKYVFAARSS